MQFLLGNSKNAHITPKSHDITYKNISMKLNDLDLLCFHRAG